MIRENVHNAQLAARERERARERQSRESRVCSDIKLLESALLSSALFTSQPPTSSLCTESRERERERERASEREREWALCVFLSLWAGSRATYLPPLGSDLTALFCALLCFDIFVQWFLKGVALFCIAVVVNRLNNGFRFNCLLFSFKLAVLS